MNKKILIGTGTYNEANNIKTFLNSILKIKINLDILIVDDSSPDGTSIIINDFKKKNKNIFLISRENKQGLDTAHKLIYNHAIKNNYDYLITMDADMSHDPNDIIRFLDEINYYDCVVGSRYIDGGQIQLRGYRYLLSKYGNLFIKKFLNLDLSEYTTSFRCFNLKKLDNFNFNQVKGKGYSFFMHSIYIILNLNFSVKEIPIIFYERNEGVSKIPKIELLRTLILVFLLKFKNYKKYIV